MVKKSQTIIISQTVYPLEAIYAASYVFIDKVYIFLADAGRGKIAITFTAKEGTSQKELSRLIGEFNNELLNASLRQVLGKNNQKIRQRIIERALYASIGEDEI